MKRIDPYSLPRPERKVEERTFNDDGIEFALALREPNAGDVARASEVCDRLVEDFITGVEGVRGPAEFPDPDVKSSRTLFLHCAITAELQVWENPAQGYQPHDFVVLSARLPRTWAKISIWVGQLLAQLQGREGNG